MAYTPPDAQREPARVPLLWTAVACSLILHAAAIGLWPDQPNMISEPTPAAPTVLNVRTQGANAQPAASYMQASPKPVSPPLEVAGKPAPRERDPQRNTRPPADTEPSAVIAESPAPAAQPATHAGTDSRMTTAKNVVDGDTLRKHVNDSLRRALLAHFEYPPVARRRGWEGVVQIGIRVEADGQLSRLRLIASSGHALLDRAALQSLGRVEQLSESVDWLNGRQVDMILPVRYQLIDS